MRIKIIFKNILCFTILLIASCVFMSCTLKEKKEAYEKVYSDDGIVIDKEIGAEDMSDVMKFISKINYKDMAIPTEEQLKADPGMEEFIWEELVDNTEYKRMPVGYTDDFNLRRFLSVEYTYNMYINGPKGISWDDECDFVKEFLLKRIFEKIGL